MVTGEAFAESDVAAAAAEIKAYLRIGHDGEDALVERLARTAAELCEAFTRQAMLERSFTEILPPSGHWTRLGRTPVKAIGGVEAVAADGSGAALAADAYAIDIDANGDGWVRVTRAVSGRVRVSYRAGFGDWAEVPETLRHGVVRLAAHMFMHRDQAEAGAPPAAVTALWRPWRRLMVGA